MEELKRAPHVCEEEYATRGPHDATNGEPAGPAMRDEQHCRADREETERRPDRQTGQEMFVLLEQFNHAAASGLISYPEKCECNRSRTSGRKIESTPFPEGFVSESMSLASRIQISR